MPIDVDRIAHNARTVIQQAPRAPRGLFVAVGVGIAFGIGTVVGGSGEARADRPRSEDELAAAVARADKLDETRLKLTYANELTKPDPVEPSRVLAQPAKPAAPAKEEAAEPIEAPPAPVVDEEVPPAPPAKEDGPDEAEDVDKKSAADLKAAIERVVADVKPSHRFALQVAAAPTQQGADDVAAKLAAEGHKTRVVEGQVGGKAVFRVRILGKDGGFTDRASADAYKQKLAMPAFIVNE